MATRKQEQYSDDLSVLVEISRQLGATTELTPLLSAIAEAAIQVLKCERATVFLYDETNRELYSKVATGTDEIRFSVDLGIAGEAARTDSIINVPDAYADSRFNREIDKKTGFRTRNILTFPMKGHEDRLVGVLQVLNKTDGPFTSRDEQLAAALDGLAGVAVHRQMLLDEYAEKQKLVRDLAVARQIQQSLIPDSAPSCPGYDIAGYNKPADATGGDCFDYPPASDDRIGLLIADATGHGIGPALLVSQYRAMIQALLSSGEDVPHAVARANDLLSHDSPPGMFITSFVGVLDPGRNRIYYVSAGHGPLLHYKRKSGERIELSASGVPLGIMSPWASDEVSPIEMAPGDVFLLMTDGFFEWTNPEGEQFGIERLLDIVENNPRTSSASLIKLIHEAVIAFASGTPQSDDLTAIVVKRD